MPPVALPVAPAPPAPVVVTVVAVPITPTLPISLLANSSFVLGTACLPWEPQPPVAGAAPTVRLTQRILIYVFVGRCTLDQSAASLAVFNTAHVLTFALTGAAWSRILTEYLASGLLSMPITDLPSLIDAVLSVAINASSNLVLHAADVIVGEPWSVPGVAPVAPVPAIPAVPAVRAARGRPARPRVPAVPAVPGVAGVPVIAGPPDLALLTFLTLNQSFRPGTAAPLLSFARLALVAGDCLTQAARAAPLALPRLSMAILRPNLERRIFGAPGGVSDAAAAMQLPDFILMLQLPPMWQLGALEHSGVQRELSDTILYCFGTAADRRAVETSRLSSTTRCAAALTHAPPRLTPH